LTGLLLLVAEYGYFVKNQPTSQLPVNRVPSASVREARNAVLVISVA